ncbi:MAG: amidohydrolase, partial [Marmoricola sp.]|nr:amidohydrolase [Marmoricola sp.]
MRMRLQHALLETGVAAGVLLKIEDGRITSARVDGQSRTFNGDPSPEHVRDPRLAGETGTTPGLTLPGFANCHSHAFHRALRGRTQQERGSFWTWREQMYAVAADLTPDTYFELARDTYAEVRATGITAVGEFHY